MFQLDYNKSTNKKEKGAFLMEATLKKESQNPLKAREELFRALDQGIRDMEQGNVISHEKMMQKIREKYGLN